MFMATNTVGIIRGKEGRSRDYLVISVSLIDVTSWAMHHGPLFFHMPAKIK